MLEVVGGGAGMGGGAGIGAGYFGTASAVLLGGACLSYLISLTNSAIYFSICTHFVSFSSTIFFAF